VYLPNVTNDLQSSHEYADNYLKDAQIHKYSVLVAKIPNACEGKTSIQLSLFDPRDGIVL